MLRKSLFTVLTIALASMLIIGLTGCEGEKGPAGPAGTNPASPPIVTAVVAAPDSIGTGEHTTLFVQAYDPNGDEMTYAWTTTGGTLSGTNTAVVAWTAPAEMGLYQVSVTVTDADGSANGSVTIGVNVYLPTVFPSYLGDNSEHCKHCHEPNVNGWLTTGHAAATAAVDPTNRYCLQCHSTGFDDEYAEDGTLIAEGLDNGGYDENPIAGLEGVQCEACHNPTGPEFADHSPGMKDARRGARCDKCHGEYEEYITSGHGTAMERAGGEEAFNDEWGRSSCNYCHTNEGFIQLSDPEWASRELPEVQWQVTCASCHDVHMTADSTNPASLRLLAPVTLSYGSPEFPDGYTIENWGAGQLCVQCHHARRSIDNITGQIENGSAHPGPHASPQADMIVGVGCWELEGYTYNRTSPHTPETVGPNGTLEDMCVKCHIYSEAVGTHSGPPFGHTFAPNVLACNTCHVTPADFDYGGKRTEIQGLLDELFTLLPNDGTEVLFDTTSTTREEREAGYAWYFVLNEGSMGVHNYNYAKSVLENAIDYVTP